VNYDNPNDLALELIAQAVRNTDIALKLLQTPMAPDGDNHLTALDLLHNNLPNVPSDVLRTALIVINPLLDVPTMGSLRSEAILLFAEQGGRIPEVAATLLEQRREEPRQELMHGITRYAAAVPFSARGQAFLNTALLYLATDPAPLDAKKLKVLTAALLKPGIDPNQDIKLSGQFHAALRDKPELLMPVLDLLETITPAHAPAIEQKKLQPMVQTFATTLPDSAGRLLPLALNIGFVEHATARQTAANTIKQIMQQTEPLTPVTEAQATQLAHNAIRDPNSLIRQTHADNIINLCEQRRWLSSAIVQELAVVTHQNAIDHYQREDRQTLLSNILAVAPEQAASILPLALDGLSDDNYSVCLKASPLVKTLAAKHPDVFVAKDVTTILDAAIKTPNRDATEGAHILNTLWQKRPDLATSDVATLEPYARLASVAERQSIQLLIGTILPVQPDLTAAYLPLVLEEYKNISACDLYDDIKPPYHAQENLSAIATILVPLALGAPPYNSDEEAAAQIDLGRIAAVCLPAAQGALGLVERAVIKEYAHCTGRQNYLSCGLTAALRTLYRLADNQPELIIPDALAKTVRQIAKTSHSGNLFHEPALHANDAIKAIQRKNIKQQFVATGKEIKLKDAPKIILQTLGGAFVGGALALLTRQAPMLPMAAAGAIVVRVAAVGTGTRQRLVAQQKSIKALTPGE
jgi:hypothetical protein